MKMLILLSFNGSFIQWAPGCCILVEKIITERHSCIGVSACSTFGKVLLAHFPLNESAEAACCAAAFLQAIIAAADGGILRWDEDRKEVVDELAPPDVFADDEPIALTHAGKVALGIAQEASQ